MSGETGVENRESMAVKVEMAMLKNEWEEKKARSVEVGKVLEDLKLHKLRMKRQQELGMRINKVIESLTGDLEAKGHQEEELRQFAASHTSYALHQGHTRNHKDYS